MVSISIGWVATTLPELWRSVNVNNSVYQTVRIDKNAINKSQYFIRSICISFSKVFNLVFANEIFQHIEISVSKTRLNNFQNRKNQFLKAICFQQQ